jgi:hypothetical protein
MEVVVLEVKGEDSRWEGQAEWMGRDCRRREETFGGGGGEGTRWWSEGHHVWLVFVGWVFVRCKGGRGSLFVFAAMTDDGEVDLNRRSPVLTDERHGRDERRRHGQERAEGCRVEDIAVSVTEAQDFGHRWRLNLYLRCAVK